MMKSASMAGVLVLAACNGGEGPNVTADEAKTYDGIAADETLYFGGSEPFWGGEVSGESLLYTQIENPEGDRISVKRFAGLNGLGFSGELDGAKFDMAVTPGNCSDGMSDREYPFTVTLSIGGDVRNGCGHTDRQPFTGPENP